MTKENSNMTWTAKWQLVLNINKWPINQEISTQVQDSNPEDTTKRMKLSFHHLCNICWWYNIICPPTRGIILEKILLQLRGINEWCKRYMAISLSLVTQHGIYTWTKKLGI